MASNSLLDIPRELRDRILELAICAKLDAPRPPGEAGISTRKRLTDIGYKVWHADENVLYLPKTVAPASLSLLLTNRQIHDETTETMKRTGAASRYELDLMLVDEHMLLPTWVCVPSFCERVTSVHTTLRICGGYPGRFRSIFTGGDGGPPKIVWRFYSVLERFLQCGPMGENAKRKDLFITIDSVDIDIITPELAPNHKFGSVSEPLGQTRRNRRPADEMQKEVIHPEQLALFLWSEILGLLHLSCHTASFCNMLYEQIGTMRILVDGEFFRALHLSDDLNRAQWEYDPHLREESRFRKWKKKTMKSRKSLGWTVTSDDAAKRVTASE